VLANCVSALKGERVFVSGAEGGVCIESFRAAFFHRTLKRENESANFNESTPLNFLHIDSTQNGGAAKIHDIVLWFLKLSGLHDQF
jgi:hypothetical protein